MTMNYRGKDGIREALHMLKNFYIMFKEEEMMKLNQTEIITTLDLNELKKMKAQKAFLDRIRKTDRPES